MNTNTGCEVGGPNTTVGSTILWTNNRGTNWISQSTGTINHLTSVHLIDATTGYAVCIGGTILKTINSGSNWQSQVSGTINVLYSVNFVSPNVGYIVRDGGTIYKTTNGGTNRVN